jgi:hypothetical protein
MSMAQFKYEEVSKLYWAVNDGFKTGRDPMGIQNSSVVTYAELLPGLTNLTAHIRYYSIYCWILNEYDNLEKTNRTKIHQYNFIRRAELAIAFIMKNAGENGVVGADFAYRTGAASVYKLSDGGDYESRIKYWKFKTGAFGQYYLGSLINLELVKTEDYRFYLRNKGKELAEAMKVSVNRTVLDCFLNCILSGRISEQDIETLSPLRLSGIEVDTEEWTALNNLLFIPPEDSQCMRYGTVLLMLQDIKGGIKMNDFVEYRFNNYSGSSAIDAEFGWYFYYLCEAFHYCVESVFCMMLYQIKRLKNPPINEFLNNIQDTVLKELKEAQRYSSVDAWRFDCKSCIPEMWSDLKTTIREGKYIEACAKSLPLMLRLSNEYESKKTTILSFENKYELSQQRGILSDAVKSYVLKYNKRTVADYVELLFKQVINEHTLVALNKMTDNKDPRKFIIENGRITLIEQRYPNETTPRIRSLYTFLRDMKYITNDGKLTNVANLYINTYGNK